jgi:hypothetical protein
LRDHILKERLFGLSGNEGNHGEEVKECYFYLDSTPTHSYMKFLYKSPQQEFRYLQLIEEHRRRGNDEPEFELLDTGIFDDSRYFDVVVEYAKADVEDMSLPDPIVQLSCTILGKRWLYCEGEPELELLPRGHGTAVSDYLRIYGIKPLLRGLLLCARQPKASLDALPVLLAQAGSNDCIPAMARKIGRSTYSMQSTG